MSNLKAGHVVVFTVAGYLLAKIDSAKKTIRRSNRKVYRKIDQETNDDIIGLLKCVISEKDETWTKVYAACALERYLHMIKN